jgi:ferrous iron transport protein B
MTTRETHFLLIGNPNVGKSTYFASITKQHALIGNRPGVTTEQQLGSVANQPSAIIEDLPGIYYIDADYQAQSIDQQVTLERLDTLTDQDILVNIIDCRSLRRNLYLTLQLIELQHPMIVILNFNENPSLQKIINQLLGIKTVSWENAQNISASLASIPSIQHLPDNLFIKKHFIQLKEKTTKNP